MAGSTLWCVVLLLSTLAIIGTFRAAETCAGFDPGVPTKRRAKIVVLCALALLALALLWRVRSVAEVDASLVERLARFRGEALDNIMSVVTTMGDTIPCLLIACVTALLIHRQGIHRWAGFVLPLVILVELAVQFAFGQVFDDFTIGRLSPDIVLGGTGTIPSGSVARLTSLFLTAAFICHVRSPRTSDRVASLGACLVLVQTVSRLYLGRHLLADMAAGMLLGVVLTAAVAWLLSPILLTPGDRRSARGHHRDLPDRPSALDSSAP